MTTPANGDRFIQVMTADGKVVPFKITAASAAGDRAVQVVTASGQAVLMKVKPVLSDGDRGIPVLCADGKVVLVREASGVIGNMTRVTGFQLGGTYTGGVIRWCEDDDSITAYATNTTTQSIPSAGTTTVMPQGFDTIYGASQFGAGNQSAAVLGNDLYVIAGNKWNRVYWDTFPTASTDASVIAKYNRATNAFDALGFTNKYLIRAFASSNARLQNLVAVGSDLYVLVNSFWFYDDFNYYNAGWYRVDAGPTLTLVSDSTALFLTASQYLGACEWGGKLVMYGSFSATGPWGARLAVYTPGGGWSSLGTFNGTVYEAWTDDAGDLYAVGAFTDISGTAINRVAKYSGGAWSAVGGGVKDSRSGGNAGGCCGRIAQGKLILLGQFNECGTDALGNKLSFTINSGHAAGNIVSLDLATNAWTLISNDVPQYDGIDQETYTGNLLTTPRTWEVGGKIVFATPQSSQDCVKTGIYQIDPSDNTWQNLFPAGHNSWSEFNTPIVSGIAKLPKINAEDPQYWFVFGLPRLDVVGYQFGGDYDTDAGLGATYAAPVTKARQRSANVATRHGFDLTASIRLVWMNANFLSYRWQGAGAASKGLANRIWEIVPSGAYPLATEMVDYIKPTEPRPWWADYYFEDLASHGIWPMYDAVTDRILLQGLRSTWQELSAKDDGTIRNPQVNPTTLELEPWIDNTAGAWQGNICQSPSGTWYRASATYGNPGTAPLQYWTGSSWADCAGWGSVSSADRAYYNASLSYALSVWSDANGIIYGLGYKAYWMWSGGTYSIISKLADAPNYLYPFSEPVTIGNYVVFFASRALNLPTPNQADGGEWLCRIPIGGGTPERLYRFARMGTAMAGAWPPTGGIAYITPFAGKMLAVFTNTYNNTQCRLSNYIVDAAGTVTIPSYSGAVELKDDFTVAKLDGCGDGPGNGLYDLARGCYRPTHNRIELGTVIPLV